LSDPGLLDDAGQPERGDPQPPGPQWGIFDQSLQPVIVGDSCLLVDFRKGYRISDYQVEPGSFASYNKVETPYDFKMTFTKGGSENDRQVFLNTVASVVASISLYNAVAGEVSYPNANPTDYNYRRTNTEGMTLLTVEIMLEEVRPTAQATFSSSSGAAPITNPQNPAAASQTNNGPVQPSIPTASQSASFLNPNDPTLALFQ
jgi:hypothetical protein